MGVEGRGEGRERLDTLLVARGLAPTRAKAQALVLAGLVASGGRRLDKPGLRLPRDAPIEVAPTRRYVSRGGHKLAPLLDEFGIHVRGREVLDVGASTGGFTHVLLEAGASKVVALDVGRGLIDWSLRNDPRVIVLEGMNARDIKASDLPVRPSLAVVDVSFISLERVLPAIAACLEPGGEIVALVKPQFEVGRGRVGKGGVVRDPAARREVVLRIAGWSRDRGWGVQAVAPSALTGAEGNVEFFLHLLPGRAGLGEEALAEAIARAVAAGAPA
jgi:23S rRNA (cytidine1920-2'-O)/16S rRNA (cytidine1409-2'-O)-methyltransferase